MQDGAEREGDCRIAWQDEPQNFKTRKINRKNFKMVSQYVTENVVIQALRLLNKQTLFAQSWYSETHV